MQEARPNTFARGVALLALALAFVLVIYVVATNEPKSNDGNEPVGTGGQPTKVHPRFQRALQEGVYVIRPGDTLVAVAEQTGIDIDDLEALNPNLDPQALISGQKIKLR